MVGLVLKVELRTPGFRRLLVGGLAQHEIFLPMFGLGNEVLSTPIQREREE